MTRLARALNQVGVALDELSREWALIGGLAVSALTEPRFTRDIDLAVVVHDDGDAEALTRSLGAKGFELQSIVEQEAANRLAMVRLAVPGDDSEGIVVDLLFASSGIENELVAAARRVEVMSGVTAPLPAIGHMIALKLLSQDERRPQDSMDLHALVGAATDLQLDQARKAIALITARAFHRGRDLAAALDSAIRGNQQ